MKKNTEKQKQDYSALCNLAAQARVMRTKDIEENNLMIAPPLNHYIKKIYNVAHLKLNTFNSWKKEGFKVKKGEKGFLFFSTPKTFKKEVENSKGESQEIKFSRFCKCFLFTENQVEPI